MRTLSSVARQFFFPAVSCFLLLSGCGGKKNNAGGASDGSSSAAQTKAQAVQDAVTGVAFDPAVAAGGTGAVRGVATASGVRGIDLGGAEQGVRGGVRGGVRAGALRRAPYGSTNPSGRRQGERNPVRGEPVEPRRQDGGDSPVAGARVRIEGTSLETVTNKDGEFRIPFIPPGNYMIVGEKQGESGEVYAFAQSSGVTAGGEADLGSLSLAETGAIKGQVKRADATSQLGIDVFIPGTSFVAKTDDDGNFNIVYVPKGTYKLAAMFPGFEPFRWKDVSVQSKQTTALEAVELKRAAQDKAKAASIFGRVTAAGGGGVRDAVVTTVPDTQNVRSDSAGNFIISNIAPGVYLVKASRPGFTENSTFVDLTETLFDQVEIGLAPSAQLLSEADKSVKAGAAPTVTIDGPNAVSPGSTVAFKAAAADSDSETLYLKWKSSGGSFDNTWSTEVNWTAPTSKGVFILEVTVTDGVLSDKASTAISVAPEGQTVALDTTPPFPPRPDKLTVKSNPPGTQDTIEGKAGCVEPNATVKFYADGLLATLLATAKAGADGSFAAVEVGDNKGDQNDQIFIGVFDPAGNLSPVYFVVNDKTPPDTVITATPCSAGQSTCLSAKNSAMFSFNTTEPGAVFECKVDEGAYDTCSSPSTYSNLANGAHLLYVRAKDAAGNVDLFPASFTWSVDASPPTVGTLSATNASTSTHVDGSFDLSGTITEVGSSLASCEACLSIDGTCDTEWKAAGLTGIPPTYTCSATALACTDAQNLTLNLRAVDQAQNVAIGTALSRKCDTLAPTTASDAPASWVNTDVTVTLTRTDAGSGVSGGSATTLLCKDPSDICTPDTAGTSVTVTCAAGTVCQQYVRYFSRDAVGNQENAKSVLVRIDKQAPTTSFSAPVDGAILKPGNSMAVSGTASDGSGSGVTKVEFSSNGGSSYSNSTGTTSWSTSFTIAKINHNLRVRATDASGNVETASAGLTAWANELSEADGAGHPDGSGAMVYTRGHQNDLDGSGLSVASGGATGVAVDTGGNRLFVADTNDNRVLVFNLTAGNALVDRTADFVLGQTDLYSNQAGTTQSKLNQPQGLAYDGGTPKRLFVADQGNHRVMVFDVTAIANGENAVGVLGQPNYTSSSANTQNAGLGCTTAVNACGLNGPMGLAYYSPSLYVADSTNSRVVIFDVGTVTDGEAATTAWGQANLTSSGNSCAQNRFGSNPVSIVTASGGSPVFVTEGYRTLVFNLPAGTNANASNVLGKANFATCDCPSASASNYGCAVKGSAYLAGTPNRFFSSGSMSARILVFDVDLVTDGESAVSVLGQPDYTTVANNSQNVPAGCNTTVNGCGLDTPLGLAVGGNYLWAVDSNNHRVLSFNVGDGITIHEAANDLVGHTVAGNAVYTANKQKNPRDTSFDAPNDMALDLTNGRLFVSDSQNNRILVFNLDANRLLADRTADFVLGQSNLAQTASGATATTLNNPKGIDYDATNNRLYVADTNNNRVLVYDVASITNGEAAGNVLGQPNLTTVTNGTTQAKMYQPEDVLVRGGTLYTLEGGVGAGVGNSRVLTFNVGDGITDGEAAVNVLGQSNFNNNVTSCERARFQDPKRLSMNGAGTLLFVADAMNHRVMVFDVTTVTDGEEAANVLGQGSFGTCASGLSAGQMNNPTGLAYDTDNNWLFVADKSNNRTLLFDVATITDGESAKTEIGQADLISSTAKTDTGGQTGPTGAAFDAARDRLWVVDSGNHRILAYNIP